MDTFFSPINRILEIAQERNPAIASLETNDLHAKVLRTLTVTVLLEAQSYTAINLRESADHLKEIGVQKKWGLASQELARDITAITSFVENYTRACREALDVDEFLGYLPDTLNKNQLLKDLRDAAGQYYQEISQQASENAGLNKTEPNFG